MRKLRGNAQQLVLLFLMITGPGYSQSSFQATDSISPAKKSHAVDSYHELLRFNEPIMYLAFPFIEPILDRTVPLQEGEGKNDYWAEGHFGHRFVAYKGKLYHAPFFQRIRFTFDVSMMTRLTRDESNPLLPYSNKFGLGLDFLLSSLQSLEAGNGGVAWTTLQMHHYSNGQADSFFLDTPERRNNYAGGDFSSNYWRIHLNVAGNPLQSNLWLGGLGFQKEISLGGPLSSSKQLKDYYGDGRILFYLHWIKKSVQTVTINSKGIEKNSIKRHAKRHVGFRTEMDYLTGGLSLFPHSNNYRFGWHNYLTYMPSVTNEIGFMIHTYVGRDYLNIRFDDIVFVGSLGLYISFK